MKVNEVSIGRPDMYRGYVIKHNISVYLTAEEIASAKDITKYVLDCVRTKYDLDEYDNYSFGRTSHGYFCGNTYHVHLLMKIK